jgi:hypothetical protein
MLRVRTQSGKIIDVEEPLRYVEILDGSGDVSMVFYAESLHDGNYVTVVTPDDTHDAALYSSMYKVQFSKDVKTPFPKPAPLVTNTH